MNRARDAAGRGRWLAPGAVFVATAALFSACVYAPLLGEAFFLYDDFAHLQIVQTHGVGSLFRAPQAGMFRPVFFASLWVEFRWFGWTAPGGYVAVTALLHLLNAILIARVLRAYGESRTVAGLSATFFLVYPAVNEVHVWPACRGDLLCVTGMLVALALARGALKPSAGWKRALSGASAALALLAALLSKEFAVAFPLLLVTLALGRPGRPSAASARRLAAAAGASLAVVALFVAIRSSVMSVSSTHYGDARQLFAGAHLLRNAWGYVTALRTVPFFEETPFGSRAVAITGWLGAAAVLLGVRAAGWRAGVLLLATGAAFLAPVMWIPPVPGAAGGGHVLYPAALCVAVLQALGVAALLAGPEASTRSARGPVASAFGWTLAAGIVAGGVASGASLSRNYRDAWRLSRSVMGQVEPYLSEPALFIRNAPWGFRNGPVVTPCYAFPFYFAGLGRRVPLFRCDGVMLERGWRGTIEWTPRRPDFTSQFTAPREDETVLELDLQRRAPGGG